MKVAEKDQTIASMQKKIEELKHRAEQGSQQLQGEVQELEDLLRNKFPFDTIEPVAKGEFGGDVVQRVNGANGQRAAEAEIAVIISQALPKDVETFETIDGVWVTHPRAAIGC